MRLNICLAALAATVAFASPAAAQVVSDTETAEARGTVLLPLTLSKVDDLDFGTVIASAVAGSVTIDADTGNRTVVGGVAESPLNPGQRAEFLGSGPVGGQVTLVLTPPTSNVLMHSNNVDSITITSFVLDSGGASRVTDALGAFTVGVGGTFAIAANQKDGFYSADFDVEAQYQ
jgi:opacity protein-like surface antigen